MSLVGTVLDGRFKINERLGAGAMGTVYRATQLSIGRDVAVKVLTGMNDTAVKRFFREAQIASALQHPNTVQIIEFGQSPDGHVYLAMELVRGHTLLKEIESGPMVPRRICRIGAQLCDALEAAHRMTIVHRDLKLENVMISEDGTDHVKVLDFGIARVLGEASMQVTGAGLSAGTPNYMAPEVLGQGAEPAPPQDLYALGVMLGELALGRTMWAAQTLEVLYVAKTTNKAIEDVPPRFRPLVGKLTAREPTARPTAAQARDELRKLDRATTDPVGHMATANVAPVAIDEPDLGKLDGTLDLVALDGRSPTKQVAPPAAAFAPTAAEVGIPKDLELEPVANTKLEIESGWSKERDAKVAGKPTVKPTMYQDKRSSGAAGMLLALVLLGALGAGGYYFMTREKPAPQVKQVDVNRGVTIRIVGKSGTAITIDGKPAGKTPVRLERRASTREIVIEAVGFHRRVVPDRDQTIDISQP